MYSNPKRHSRSRCSTMIVPTEGSPMIRRNCRRSAVQTGPDFLDDLIGAAIMLSGPLGLPAGLPVKTAALVRGGNACVQNAPRTALARNDDVIPAIGELLDLQGSGGNLPCRCRREVVALLKP